VDARVIIEETMSTIAARNVPNPALRRYLDLLKILVARNLKVRYRGSFLGVYWSLLNPVLMTLIYAGVLNSLFVRYYNGSVVDYMLAVFCGMVAINFFGTATTTALPSIVGNGILLNKISLPMSVFPVSVIVASVFQLAVGAFPILVVMTLLVTRNPLNVVLLLFPLSGLVLFCIGIAFFVSMTYVYFRDLPYLYELVVFIMWVTSPVFYPLASLPPRLQHILAWNPLTSIIESLRQIVLSGATPNLHLVAQSFIEGAVVAFLGWALFRQYRDEFMDLL
jgi:ABC-type polysaccharide/polyol phosphate export permease